MKVAVGISGGVDSTLAAHPLNQAGHYSTQPLYIINIKADENKVIVGEKQYLRQDDIVISEINQLEELPKKALCRVRSSAPLRSCTPRLINRNNVRIIFDEPVEATCPGQSTVLYDGDLVIGEGIIERRQAAKAA